MAAEIEDDDAWLYGDSKKEEDAEVDDQVPGTSQLSADAPEFEPNKREVEDIEAGHVSGEEDQGGAPQDGEASQEETPMEEDQAPGEDEDEDSDDDVQVTIGDIKSGPVDTPRMFKGGAGYQRGAPAPVTAPSVTKLSDGKGIDVDKPGAINGVPIYEFDLETLHEKPWLKPGADLTDYFNYGFNEESWRRYCSKQKDLRMEYNPGSLQKQLTMNTHTATGQPHTRSISTTDENKNPNSNLVSVTGNTGGGGGEGFRRAAPPPRRKFAGTIDVIGSTDRDSRRPSNYNTNTIPVTGNEYNPQPAYGTPVSSIPTHSSGPPPPDFSAPPPMMPPQPVPTYGPPPPSMPNPNIPPPQGYAPPGYYGQGPPPGGPPPGSYDYYGNQGYAPSPQYSAPPPRPEWGSRSPQRGSPSRQWDYSGHPGERSPEYGRDRYRRSRSRERDSDRDRSERRFKEHKEHKKRKSTYDREDREESRKRDRRRYDEDDDRRKDRRKYEDDDRNRDRRKYDEEDNRKRDRRKYEDEDRNKDRKKLDEDDDRSRDKSRRSNSKDNRENSVEAS